MSAAAPGPDPRQPAPARSHPASPTPVTDPSPCEDTMDNLLGVHALVFTGRWDEPSARRALRATAEAGYDLIELPLLDPAATDPVMTRRLLAEHGLGASCSLGLSFDADVSSPDEAVAARGLTRLREALAVARGIGASYLGGVIYSALGKYPHPATPAGRANAVHALRTLAGEAADDGIHLGVEVVNRYETNLCNTAEQALELLDEVDAPNVVVHLDTYHMNIEEPDVDSPVRRCADRLGYVHVGESHRGALGTGNVDFPGFFAALAEVGYGGPITFESFSSAVVSQELSSALAVWRNLWDDGPQLAADARSFVAAQLAASGGRSATGR